jgi:exopolysaccharide production protein ExoQ
MKKLTNNRLLKLAGFPGIVLLLYPILNIFILDNESISFLSVRGFIRVAYSILIFVTVLSYINRSFYNYSYVLIKKSSLFWYLLYLIISGLSFLWSEGSAIEIIMRFFDSTSLFLLIILVVSYLTKKYNIYVAIRWVFFFLLIYIVCEIISFAKIQNLISLNLMIKSSQFACTIFFFMAWKYANRLITKWTILILGVFSGSTVGYIGMFIGFIWLLFFSSNRENNQPLKFIFFILISLFLVFVGSDSILKNTIFSDKESISYEETSGRNTIYNAAWEAFKEKPILGYGFVVGEQKVLLDNTGRFYDTSHNGFLSALLGTGMVGFLLLLTFFRISTLEIINSKDDIHLKPYLFATLIIIVTHTIGNPGIGSKVLAAWIPSILILTLIAANHLTKQKNEKNSLD